MRQSSVRRRQASAVLLVTLALLIARVGWAQEIGSIAELEGSAEVGRAGVWLAAQIGTNINARDTLRTGRPGRLRVVFRDESVLTVADGSEVAIDEQTFEPNQGVARSVFRLVQGKVRALVSDYYKQPGSEFRIDTVTALVGVRGTEFVVSFDPVTEVSEVVGVHGRAEVHSVLDRVGHAVFITAQEATTVARGQYPTAPRRLDEELFRQYLQQLGFIGAGKAESLVAAQPLLTGASVPLPDRVTAVPVPAIVQAAPAAAPRLPASAAAPGESAYETPDASGLIQQSPAVVEGTQGKLGIRF